MDLGMSDRVYVVSGASRGLGRATSRQLVAEGARLVVCSRDEAALAALADELSGGDADRVLGVPGDLGEPGTSLRLVAAAMGRFGRVDGALISVGGPPGGQPTAVTDAQWRQSFDSVFLGPLRLATAVAGSASGEGASIVFVLSTSVKSPIAGLAISNGLRPGLAMVAKNLADEVGPKGVRVNAVLPGRIATDRLRELDGASGDATRARAEWEQRIPLGRYGEPEELGRVATFLLSPASSYVTGTVIPVDGGLSRSL